MPGTEAEVKPQRICPLTSDEVIDKILSFTQTFTGYKLYLYQLIFARRIIEAVINSTGDVLTGLWSRQSGKSWIRDTLVMRFDGTAVAVQDLKVGDVLMGDDSEPRTVTGVHSGQENMWRVQPTGDWTEPYTVNESHIMSIMRRKVGSSAIKPRPFEWVAEDVDLVDLLDKNLARVRGYKVPVTFQPHGMELPLEPYFLGLWLGDGKKTGPQITTMDVEVANYLGEYANHLGMKLSKYREDNASDTYAITNGSAGTKSNTNYVSDSLRDLGVWGNKHIPHRYLTSNEEDRLSLLAGLIDSDGHHGTGPGKENTCEYVSVRKQLALDFQWLARSLGFRASIKEKEVNDTTYYRVCLYGELWRVPMRVPHKQYQEAVLANNPRFHGFSLVDEGPGTYYGFTLEKGTNRRCLLHDFTVIHNTETISNTCIGLAVLVPELAKAFPDDGRFKPFKNGLLIGVYAPILDQAQIPFSRMRQRVHSKLGQSVLTDPELMIKVTSSRGDLLRLSNGSEIRCKSASPDSNIEGATHHLVIVEEAQKVSRTKIEKEISPMLASTNGCLTKIGTAWISRGGFHTSIKQNIESYEAGGPRNHFEFPYDVVIREKERAAEDEKERGEQVNPFHGNYAKYIEQELKRCGGEDTDEFKMNFRCLWQDSRLVAINEKIFGDAALDLEAGPSKEGFQVAGLDVGKTNDSSVLTLMEIDFSHPITSDISMPGADEDKQTYYRKIILDWMELAGSFEGDSGQYSVLIEYLLQTNVQILVVDATGMGDPVYERIVELCGDSIMVVPYKLNLASKSHLYKYYLQEVNARRLFYAAGEDTKKLPEYRRFQYQHFDLDKKSVGSYISVQAADEDGHDDYPDSAALACWAEKLVEQVKMGNVTSSFPSGRGRRGKAVNGGSTESAESSVTNVGPRAARYSRRW